MSPFGPFTRCAVRPLEEGINIKKVRNFRNLTNQRIRVKLPGENSFAWDDYNADKAMSIQKTEQLARLIQYVIGRRPDEFGLVPDTRGFIPVADVLKVLHDEGWRKVRRGDLETMNYHLGAPTVDIEAHLLRAHDRSGLEGLREDAAPPKLLYAPIRRRAYEKVAQHGLGPQGHTDKVVLFAEHDLAVKVGQRRDAQPVVVTVNVEQASEQGLLFTSFGERIFLTESLPVECCRLPRPPKTLKMAEDKEPVPVPTPKTPGSFILEMEPFLEKAPPGKAKSRKHGSSKEWKKERRKARRWKEGRNAPR